MANLEREYQLVEESYGTGVLNLTLAKGYLTRLLGNAKVINYLLRQQPEIFSQFQRISEMESLNDII